MDGSSPDFQFDQCIATGGVADKTALKIKMVDIESYFPPEKVFTADLVAYGKPEPDLFLLAADVMGYEPKDCIVVEDSLAGMTGAIRAKMTVFAFLGAELYHNAHVEEEIRGLGVAEIFYTMEELKAYLERKF